MNIQNLKRTSQGAVSRVHILEPIMETLGPFQIASTFPENATVWPVFFADLCNTLKNKDGVLLFSLYIKYFTILRKGFVRA